MVGMAYVEFAKVSYAKPAAEMTIETKESYRAEAIRMLEDAIRSKGKNPKDYVARDVLPKTDLGLTNEEWSHTYSAANTEETYFSKTLGDDRFLVVYGYANNNPTPRTLYLKFERGSVPVKVIHVQNVHIYDPPEAYFEPEVWSEGEKITVYIYGDSTGEDKPILKALWAEPVAETISTK